MNLVFIRPSRSEGKVTRNNINLSAYILPDKGVVYTQMTIAITFCTLSTQPLYLPQCTTGLIRLPHLGLSALYYPLSISLICFWTCFYLTRAFNLLYYLPSFVQLVLLLLMLKTFWHIRLWEAINLLISFILTFPQFVCLQLGRSHKPFQVYLTSNMVLLGGHQIWAVNNVN